MIPIVTILGKPNVGKSSLFNKLVKQNIMLVSDFKNLTNDRNYFLTYINKYKYLLIDNKGFDDFYFKKNIFKKFIFLDECDIILFLTDSFQEFFFNNFLINYVRKKKKYIFFIVNKFDNNKFYTNNLKFILKFFIISTSHNYNIDKTIYKIIKIFCLNNFCEKISNFKKCLNICLLGKKNTGKSSYLNYLLKENRIFINKNHKTYDNILIKFKYKKIFFYFFDNFQINLKKKNIFNIKLIQNILYSNIILFFINCFDLNNEDFLILNFLIKKNLNIIIIINKIDLINLKKKNLFKKFLKKKINFYKNFYIFTNSILFKNNHIKYIYKTYKKSLKNLKLSKIFFLKKFLNKKLKNLNTIKIFQVSKNPYIINFHCINIFNFKKFKNLIKNFLFKIFKIKSLSIKINFLKN